MPYNAVHVGSTLEIMTRVCIQISTSARRVWCSVTHTPPAWTYLVGITASVVRVTMTTRCSLQTESPVKVQLSKHTHTQFSSTEHVYTQSHLLLLQTSTSVGRAAAPAPTTPCVSTWTADTTAAVRTGTTAPATASTTARSSTTDRSGSWTMTDAPCARVRSVRVMHYG